jgi:AraC family transcriptional regulator, transcriptional activator of pobA
MNLAATAPAKRQTDQQLFSKFLQLLNERYAEYGYADLFADALQVSHKKLNQVAKNITGKTTCCLVEEKIVTEAKRFLEQNRLQVKQIAWQLGYEDHYYFSRMFKKQAGLSPKAYRRQILTAK